MRSSRRCSRARRRCTEPGGRSTHPLPRDGRIVFNGAGARPPERRSTADDDPPRAPIRRRAGDFGHGAARYGRAVRGQIDRAHRGIGRAVHLRGLQQLPPRRPLAVVARVGHAGLGRPGAARPARRLLGLHRLEGPLCQASLYGPATNDCGAAACAFRLYAAGLATGARLPGLGLERVRASARENQCTAGAGRDIARDREAGRGRAPARGVGPGT